MNKLITTQQQSVNSPEAAFLRLFIEFTQSALSGNINKAEWQHKLQQAMLHNRETQPPAPSVSFKKAVEASLHARRHRRPATRADLQSYTNRMLKYRRLAGLPINQVDNHLCRQMMDETFGHSPYSYRKAQSILHSIFNYGIRQGWCYNNPAECLDLPPVQEEQIQILGITQIKRLMRACRQPGLRSMDAPVRLMLWCGIRPTEVRRLRWRDIDIKEKVVYVDPLVSKTGGARMVPLRGGAKMLLTRAHHPDQLIAPRNWLRLWQRVRAAAGLVPWQNDTLRHTFASMHIRHFQNMSVLQQEMGHRSSTLLQTRYLNLRGLRAQTAKAFFQDKLFPLN